MNNNMSRKTGNGMGYIGRFPAVCVADLPGEAMDDILRILMELDEQPAAEHMEKGSNSAGKAGKLKKDAEASDKTACPKENDFFMEMDFSGDGEEVFGKMLDDMVYLFQLESALYATLCYLADNRMSRERALRGGRELMEEADSVLEAWQRYSMTEE
ncbi:MAG: hypothetical protein LUI87_02400 [Lachnospiraceae bacterium]|nr:hypothetical protein [Lachnospiraceae bacterium]